MRAFGRRKIPTLIQFILLLTLVFLVLTLVFISASNKSAQIDFDAGTVLKTSEGISLSSACLSRDTLNSGDVQLHSNRVSSKQYYLTIGIPTIARKIGNQYLMKTLNSLTTNQTVENTKTDILIVVQLGDRDRQKRVKVSMEIKEKYPQLINSGVLDIIQVYPAYYPPLEGLKRRYRDSEKRVKWRSKQVLDFSFLFCYCSGLGKYHIQLEDDVVASPYYYLKLKDFIDKYEAKETWVTLDASVLGYIGKVYHNHDLDEMASFYYIFFDEMPVDWLEYKWREIKGQGGRWRFRSASLFQHIGLVSSLENKKQRAKEPYFDNQTRKFLGLNPPARIQTNLAPEGKTEIKSAYEQGGGYFWGRCHGQSECFIKVVFEKAIPVKRIVIETGGNIALNDTIHRGALTLGTYPKLNDCTHYETMSPGHFKKGTLDVVLAEQTKVNCFKIVIEKQQQWVFIREINVWGE